LSERLKLLYIDLITLFLELHMHLPMSLTSIVWSVVLYRVTRHFVCELLKKDDNQNAAHQQQQDQGTHWIDLLFVCVTFGDRDSSRPREVWTETKERRVNWGHSANGCFNSAFLNPKQYRDLCLVFDFGANSGVNISFILFRRVWESLLDWLKQSHVVWHLPEGYNIIKKWVWIACSWIIWLKVIPV